jgi:hypothetical protein
MNKSDSITNLFLMEVKFLRLDENGKTLMPVCEMPGHCVFFLSNYIWTFENLEEDNFEAYREAITNILANLYAVWKCPLAWELQMQTFDQFLAEDNPFYKPAVRRSKPFAFSPENGQTEIKVEFLKLWASAAGVITDDEETIEENENVM